MKALEARKRLLIAQAEMQRVEIRQDLEVIRSNLHQLGARAKSVTTIITVAQAAMAALSFFRRRTMPARGNNKSLMLSRILGGARVAFSLWQTLRSHKSKIL